MVDRRGNACLTDFGISRSNDTRQGFDSTNVSRRETLNWIAPGLIFFGNSETMRMEADMYMHLLVCYIRQVVLSCSSHIRLITPCFHLTLDLYRRHPISWREHNRLPEGTKETLAARIGRTHHKTYWEMLASWFNLQGCARKPSSSSKNWRRWNSFHCFLCWDFLWRVNPVFGVPIFSPPLHPFNSDRCHTW